MDIIKKGFISKKQSKNKPDLLGIQFWYMTGLFWCHVHLPAMPLALVQKRDTLAIPEIKKCKPDYQ